MKRYRVNFTARFDVTIEASSQQEACSLANEMEHLPWSSWAAASDVHKVSCNWNTLEPEPVDG